MVLEGLRKSFLKRKLKKTRGKQREAYIREIQKIEGKQMFETKVKSIQQKAYREEQLKQAAELGKARAKISAEQKIKALKTGGGQSGFLAGFDKFLAGTGVAKGTAKVVGGGFGGTGKGFDPIGGSGTGKKKGGYSIV